MSHDELGPPRDARKARLLRLYAALAERFGPQRVSATTRAFEVAVAAILAPEWTSAARGVEALRAARALTPRALAELPAPAIEALIRPAGSPPITAARLRAFAGFVVARHAGRLAGMRRAPLGPLRSSLLDVPGLRPETVDAILLHAVGRPVFVADAHARRVLARHRLVRPDVGYEALRAFAERHLPSDPRLLGELHALLVTVGQRYCRPGTPLCAACPLRWDLRGRAPA